jgi:hypothetical protein
MSLDLSPLDYGLPQAVKHFWASRTGSNDEQAAQGNAYQGRRSEVVGGKNLDGFVSVVRDLAIANGMSPKAIFSSGSDPTLPGFFRGTKKWDVVIVDQGQLVAAIEFKSQVGPSFGNNFNNRTEEAIGNSVDLLTAHREGAFGAQPRPFLGYVFVLEECEKSLRALRVKSRHFKMFPEFNTASYAERYEVLCRKLVQEQLYDGASLILTKSGEATTGAWRSLSEATDPRMFARLFAGRIASASTP